MGDHEIGESYKDGNRRRGKPSQLERLNSLERDEKPLPELQHNLKSISDVAELKLRNEKENKLELQKEKQRLQIAASNQKRQLDYMEDLASKLDKILLFVRRFQGWNPLQNPSYGLESMSEWKDLLLAGEDFCDRFPSYTHLVREIVLHAVCRSSVTTWEARDPEPMIHFLKLWENRLPPPVLQDLLYQVVMPKLSDAVDSWKPHEETVPIHTWVLPWLPFFGSDLGSLYYTIGFKMGIFLRACPLNDASAYALLSPWKTVFGVGGWARFVAQHLIPKLVDVLQRFLMHPGGANQQFDDFKWVMSWAPLVPIQQMVQMLQKHFFPGVRRVFRRLQRSDRPKFVDTAEWYFALKELLPPKVLAHEGIRSQALELSITIVLADPASDCLFDSHTDSPAWFDSDTE